MDSAAAIESVQADGQQQRLGWFPYAVSILSFVPLIGVPVGLICIVYGIAKRRSRGLVLAGIGAAGVCFTIAIYGSIFYMATLPNGPMADGQRKLLREHVLPGMVKTIEYYKVQKGHYPSALADVAADAAAQTKLQDEGVLGSQGRIHYEMLLDGSGYYLLTTGPDKTPYTADDIYPAVSQHEAAKIGYRVKP